MSLLALPNELIHRVVSDLPPFVVERVAKSSNHRIYHICLPFIEKRLATRRNAAIMIKRFDGRGWLQYRRLEKVYQLSGLEDKYGPVTFTPDPNLDYLDLNGDLHWLNEHNLYNRNSGHSPRQWKVLQDFFASLLSPPATEVQVEELVRKADQLGLSFPDSFTDFMLNRELRLKLGSSSFTLGHLFYKCPHNFDEGAGGYMLRIYRTRRGDDTRSSVLYLTPGTTKGHCVLELQFDIERPEDELDELNGQFTEEEANTAEELGVKMAKVERSSVILAAPSFEEFLVKICYEGWLSAGCDHYPDQGHFTDSESGMAYIRNLVQIDEDGG